MTDAHRQTRKDVILRAVANAGELLLQRGEWTDRLADVLAELGRATEVDRVYLFEVFEWDGALLTSQRDEWVADGVEPQIDNPDLTDLPFVEAGFGRWAEVLPTGAPIYGNVDDFPESEQEFLRDQQITSLVVVPVNVDDRWWGFLGFDATREPKDWEAVEVDALRAAAGAIGAAISNQRLVDELVASRSRYVDAFRREREASERLRQLDAMRNTFLDAVSHELRTPLHTIMAIAETLQQRADRVTPEEQGHLVDRLAVNGQRLDRIIAGLLDLNRLRHEKVEVQRTEVEVADLVHATVASCDALADWDIDVSVGDASAAIDVALTERILVNLLENAVVHAHGATRLWVRADVVGNTLELVVEDDGCGIPAAHREDVFEPFAHGEVRNAHSPGTGLGLAIVRRFAQLHGGDARVMDRDGGGASFHVSLACEHADALPG